MDPLAERVKPISWWTLLKMLSFDGGPSSTRFVFLATFAVSALVFLMISGAFSYVYIHDPAHPAGAGILAVLTLMLGGITGIAANSQNVRHQLTAQLQSGTPINASSTPATAEVGGTADGS